MTTRAVALQQNLIRQAVQPATMIDRMSHQPSKSQIELLRSAYAAFNARNIVAARMISRMSVVLVLALAAQSAHAQEPSGPSPASLGVLDSTLVRLYTAFSFQRGREPDWQALRRLMLHGAAFVEPVRPNKAPRADNTTTFLATFRRAVRTDRSLSQGFVERIVATRVDVFGTIAHAYVTFEGTVPDVPGVVTRGVDSIQLIHTARGWQIASFTTQYETPELPLPARFR